MSNGSNDAVAPNAQRLLWAGFMAILAAGMGFSIRGGILTQWANKFGFTMTELGTITGGGLTGAGIIILAGAFMADKVGYGKLMALAFVTHFVSAVLTLAAGPAFLAGGKPLAFQCLYWGMFLFAVGNGICEAVVNPLVATLFPKNKTHYLNILHAGWPGGLIIGGLVSYFMNPDGAEPVSWQVQMTLFLLPVVLYGLMLLGQRFPRSEASEAGVSYGVIESLRAARPQLKFLELAHRLDRDTSGLLILTKKRAALTAIHAALREGRLRKRYLALVKGKWKGDARRVSLPLRKYLSGSGERRVSVDATGRESQTLFRRKRAFRDCTLLWAELLTGRTHQIRVHLAHLGHPVLGDDKYGDFELNREIARTGLRRMFLHAAELELEHPLSGQKLKLDSPLPVALARFLDSLPA